MKTTTIKLNEYYEVTKLSSKGIPHKFSILVIGKNDNGRILGETCYNHIIEFSNETSKTATSITKDFWKFG